MPNDSWWEAQESLHRRLQAAEEISDDDERDEARRDAWAIYHRETD